LLREYLDLEFSSLATQIPFEYSFERIIDDFILMGVFVGNDFLPHLPDLHINEGALERIWTIYKEILPEAGELAHQRAVAYNQGDISTSTGRYPCLGCSSCSTSWRSSRSNILRPSSPTRTGTRESSTRRLKRWRRLGRGASLVGLLTVPRLTPVITRDQQKIFNQIKKFVTHHQTKPSPSDRCTIVNTLSARDRRFLQELTDSLHLRATWDETDEYGQPLVVLTFDLEGVSEDEGEDVEEDGEWESDEANGEGDVAIQRVLQKYEKAKVVENTVEDFEESYEQKLKEKLDDWKRGYYKVSLEGLGVADDCRRNSRSITTIPPSLASSSIATSRACNGLSTTTTRVSRAGDGSTTTTSRRESLVGERLSNLTDFTQISRTLRTSSSTLNTGAPSVPLSSSWVCSRRTVWNMFHRPTG
jgi:5'-3' exoribonuclease 1